MPRTLSTTLPGHECIRVVPLYQPQIQQAVAANLAELCGVDLQQIEKKIPSTIEFLGNTSVATIPTMLDMIRKKRLNGFEIRRGELCVMASVGAGMHCNALVYRF